MLRFRTNAVIMKTFLCSCVAFFTLFVSVESLTCNTCDASILGYCAISDAIICSSGQNSCYSGVASVSGAVGEIHSKGCVESANCKNSTTLLFNNPNVKLTVTMNCCNTPLCNGAGPGLAPLTVGSVLGALLLAFGGNLSL